jgi:NADPH-dependent 2,4-dienoyl-CoA reductase/sulfur reductase-like enzyme/peroxiredoxin family protein/TusA-related sulfurtransferase/rhodanese-related sulfurtransferase
MRVVIVGGVAGGATTAARLRRIDENAEVIIFERGEHISYANCGLPYYIGGVIEERDRLFVQTPESFYSNYRLEVRTKQEVLSIDRDRKEVTVRKVDTGEEYTESYDKLVLSPGAEPFKPPIPGINSEGIFTLRSVPETDAIKAFVDERSPKRAVIVGAGFIGLEMAENLHDRGVFVTIVEMAQQVMNVVDFEMAAMVHQHLKTKNVEFYLRDGVSSFERDGDAIAIQLKSGRTITADMVILSIGVRPESRLAKEAGLDVGPTGGIKVDTYLRTTDPDVYACGDVIEYPNPITGAPTITYLAGPANKQGRIVANNIVYGDSHEYHGSIQTAVAKVFDITVATTGASEKALEKAGVPYATTITHSSSHAGYYPGALAMSIKTIFDPTDGRLFGAQIVGYEGVDKRIDLMATVVRNNGTIRDLTEIEHAYAPPYSSAKDPVNIAGFVAENVILKRSRHIQWHQVMGCDLNEMMLVDVRTPEEHEIGSIEGAVNIPLYELRDRIDEIDRNRTIVVFCGVGLRAYHAERILVQSGFTDVFNLSGGYKTFETATEKQSNEDIYATDYIGKDDNIYQTDVEHLGGMEGPEARARGGSQSAAESGETAATASVRVDALKVDATGLQCPGPIMKLKKSIDSLAPGEQLIETATDPGFARDVASWCKMTGNSLVKLDTAGGVTTAVIEKTDPAAVARSRAAGGGSPVRNGSTLVVFSDDMDRALASLVIANGAASAGKKVTLFFTFWGLSILKRDHKPRVRKDAMGRMFGWMLPGGTQDLKLSKMNFGGMGAAMMKARMKSQKVDPIDVMLANAVDAGVRLVACQMSMDVMGVKREELIDGVEIGGVANYLEATEDANLNLFV